MANITKRMHPGFKVHAGVKPTFADAGKYAYYLYDCLEGAGELYHGPHDSYEKASVVWGKHYLDTRRIKPLNDGEYKAAKSSRYDRLEMYITKVLEN